MAVTSVFLDTDVLINWLTKETDPQTHEHLWKAPHRIIKHIEGGKLQGYCSMITLMEIRFVLRRKKKWAEEEISQAINRMQTMKNLTILVPTDTDVITGYNLLTTLPLGPFDAIYFGLQRTTPADHFVSRDKGLIATINQAEGKQVASTPESLLKKLKL